METITSYNNARYATKVSTTNITFLKTKNEIVELCLPTRNLGNFVVFVHNLCKSYEKGRPALSSLSLGVERGIIYGLLGASGSGKSTLLSCIVGLRKWDAGEILLSGKRPKGSPGRRVGYMPQEVALHGTLSVRETVEYFGRLYGMTKKDIRRKWTWLLKFLQLPSDSVLISDLSGGEQRRVSLAVTIIHSPELLILDEPTVGLDPLLRDSIWEYLRLITQSGKTTVIITTHYIEELRTSDKVGLLRNGRMLVEDKPENLLLKYQCEMLEQVMLKLCKVDEQKLIENKRNAGRNYLKPCMKKVASDNELNSVQNSITWTGITEYNCEENFEELPSSSSTGRITALCTVIWLMFSRHLAFTMMIILLPTSQIILTLAVEGAPPRDLNIGIVNDEVAFDKCAKNFQIFPNRSFAFEQNVSCNFHQLSCNLIAELSLSGTFTLVPLQSIKIAKEKSELGDLHGYFTFPSNYSQHISDLVTTKLYAESSTLDGSRVHFFMDMSNFIVTLVSTNEAFTAYQRFTNKLAHACGLNPLEFQLPIMFRQPMYGETGNSNHEYFVPLVLLCILFEVTVLMTSVLFINDRKQGTLDRALVAGAGFNEVLISHVITQGSVMIGQILIFSTMMYLVYGMRVSGSYYLFFLLCLLGGLCGQALGLLLGVVFKHESEAIMFGVLILMGLFIYEGAFWPVKGMNYIVRNVAYCLPTTFLAESIRSVMYREAGVLSTFVWPGIVVTIGWTCFFWVISIWIFRRRFI